jgi:hypothetical protein
MRPSDVPRRVRTGTILVLAVAGSVVLAGCSSDTTSGASGPKPSATEAVSREAGWFHERIRVCFQNNTSRNLTYSFGDAAVDDQEKNLSQPGGTLGSKAFVCGASGSEGPFEESVTFMYESSAGELISLYLSNSPGNTLGLNINGELYGTILEPGKSSTRVFDGDAIDVLVGTGLRTFAKVKAYPIDVRISDAP